MTHGRGKSDPAIVAVKPTNKAGRLAAEPVERRVGTEGNAGQRSTDRAQNRVSVSQALDRVRQAAQQRKKERFTALLHHVSVDLLRIAFFALKRDAAPGVDGATWQDYEADLERKLVDLHERLQRGTYRALPARRRYIPKPDGRQRPLAVAALEDKIVQRAVLAVLNAIYEEDFLGFSYGFRPERSQHDALDALVVGIGSTKVNWILDADIRSFFDEVGHEWLIRFVRHRIADPRVVRLILKWLKAGVLEDGVVMVGEKGTGQGSVISPLLTNVYLHYVFDLWAERWRRLEATGDMLIVRYADDIVVGFQHETDARRFWNAMRERLREFALTLHPGKDPTHRVRPLCSGKTRRAWAWQTGDLQLSWLHIHLWQITPGKVPTTAKVPAKLKEVKEELRRRMHQPIPEQGRWLRQVVCGFSAYHAVPTNDRAIAAFRHQIVTLWRRALKRRGQRDRTSWQRIERIAEDFLPPARILHPWPDGRFAVKHPRWEPSA